MPPWELAKQSIAWLLWAAAAETAEGKAAAAQDKLHNIGWQ